jgi:hypothetical protein
MRQRRDGETEIVDRTPYADHPGLLALLARPRWRIGLVWFMRTLAGVWIAKGLFNWFVVLGFSSRFGDFVMLPRALQASIVFFAAADLLAAIGLWLAAPWGGALWLLCAASEATTPLMGSRGSFINGYGAALNLVLIAAYLALSWLAARDRE